MRWKISDEKKLVFVAGYQEAYSLLYVEKLILMVMNDFTKKEYDSINVKNGLVCEEYDYTKKFMNIINQWMNECEKAFEGGDKAKEVFKKEKVKEKEKNKSVDKNNRNEKEKDDKQEERVKSQGPETRVSGGSSSNQNIPKNILAKRGSKVNKDKEKEPEKPKGKEKTVWNDIDKYSHQNETKYDFSKQDSKDIHESAVDKGKYIEDEETNEENIFNDNEFDLSDGENEKTEKKGGLFSKFTSSIKNLIGNKVLTEEDLKPVMKIFVDGLIDKNVAKDIAEDVCESVKKSLLKSKTASFTTIKTTVQDALKEAISKILTPKQDLDVLKNAIANKGRGEPYKVVFIGVNGVGKSTNLAKVAYLLKKNNLNLLIAACDNFRSGAIEQLKTHCRALEVDLFEKGYKDDIAYIAKEAIEEGKRKKKVQLGCLSLKGSKLDFRHFYLFLLYCYANLCLSKSQLRIRVSRRTRFSPC
jgi:signal recognition particle receptor subunit alpha